MQDEPDSLAGYTNRSYGDGFADVYDEWYHNVSPIAATVDLLAQLAGTEPVLELGVGTGRIAIPLAETIAPRAVWGIDASPEMLAVLASNSAASPSPVTVIEGDMALDLPDQTFSVVFAAYNTFFNLPTEDLQRSCLHSVAERLSATGRLLIEVFNPTDAWAAGAPIAVRSMTSSEVVLTVTEHRPEAQTIAGQFIQFRDDQRVRLRPWLLRYSTPEQLDSMAAEAGLQLEHRWADASRAPFGDDSPQHISVYRR